MFVVRVMCGGAGLDHRPAHVTRREDMPQVVTRSSLTLRVTGLSLLATARVMIKAGVARRTSVLAGSVGTRCVALGFANYAYSGTSEDVHPTAASARFVSFFRPKNQIGEV